jgi:hypothetical protein
MDRAHQSDRRKPGLSQGWWSSGRRHVGQSKHGHEVGRRREALRSHPERRGKPEAGSLTRATIGRLVARPGGILAGLGSYRPFGRRARSSALKAGATAARVASADEAGRVKARTV